MSSADLSAQPIVQEHQATTSAGHPGSVSSNKNSNARVPSAFEIQRVNEELATAEPQQILAWALQAFPTGLFQTTAFGLTGLAALDMIHKLSPEGTHAVPLIFINTLYHFPETLALAAEASQKYGAQMHVYMPPAAQSSSQFESIYGERLWEEDEESYDYLVKVEPSRRAYEELNALAVITGRRRSQGGDRASIPIIEVDSTGLIKINPLANWSFKDTKAYIDANHVPYNALLDQGYTSIGDWHSTKKPDGSKVQGLSGDAAERSGRWAGRAEKTECGLHKDYFKMKAQFNKRKREREQRARDEARGTPVDPEAASAEDKHILAAGQAVTTA